MNAHPRDGDPAQPAPARPSDGPGRAVDRRWPLAGMQAGQIALIAATVYFAFGGGAAAVVRSPDDRGLGGFAIVVGVAAALLVSSLTTLVVVHVRSILALRATSGPAAGPATRAVLQRITETALIVPLTAVVSLYHLAYNPPHTPWLVLLGLAAYGEGHAIGGRFTELPHFRRTPTPPTPTVRAY